MIAPTVRPAAPNAADCNHCHKPAALELVFGHGGRGERVVTVCRPCAGGLAAGLQVVVQDPADTVDDAAVLRTVRDSRFSATMTDTGKTVPYAKLADIAAATGLTVSRITRSVDRLQLDGLARPAHLYGAPVVILI